MGWGIQKVVLDSMMTACLPLCTHDHYYERGFGEGGLPTDGLDFRREGTRGTCTNTHYTPHQVRPSEMQATTQLPQIGSGADGSADNDYCKLLIAYSRFMQNANANRGPGIISAPASETGSTGATCTASGSR